MILTIVTINYNNLAGLRRTMQSVLAQLPEEAEYIVIDGGSADGSAEYIAGHADRLAYWVSERDRGIYHAMNKGIAKARGRYIQFLNSGDTYHAADTLALVLPRLAGKDFYTGDLLLLEGKPRICRAPHMVTAAHLSTDTLMHPATFIRTQLLKDRPYREDLRIVSDWEQMWHELAIGNATYERLDITIADFDMTGVSATCGTEALWKERGAVLAQLGHGRLWSEITGDRATRYERKLCKALRKGSVWARYFAVLSLTVQYALKSLMKSLTGRKDNK